MSAVLNNRILRNVLRAREGTSDWSKNWYGVSLGLSGGTTAGDEAAHASSSAEPVFPVVSLVGPLSILLSVLMVQWEMVDIRGKVPACQKIDGTYESVRT